MKRQNVRKLLLLISLLLFPITMWYFSPAIICQAMAEHIMNGSFFTFAAMLIFSMFFGRIFCGYLCPAGGLQECAMLVNEHPVKGGKRNYIKFVIWTVWIIALITLFCLGHGAIEIDFFYMTDHGISIAEIFNYVIYYGIILLILVPSLIHGRRALCHYICWMAPFMIIGSKIGRIFHLPQLHIESEKDKCISCRKCSKVCPMSLDVAELIKEGGVYESAECIQCGACVDSCPKDVLHYSIKVIKKEKVKLYDKTAESQRKMIRGLGIL